MMLRTHIYTSKTCTVALHQKELVGNGRIEDNPTFHLAILYQTHDLNLKIEH
jgi:hypothetical protein